jgi:hypothetical protein
LTRERRLPGRARLVQFARITKLLLKGRAARFPRHSKRSERRLINYANELEIWCFPFGRCLTQTPYNLNQTTLAEIAEITAGGTLNQVDGELEQANFPCVVYALNNRGERFVFIFNVLPGAIDHGVD